jgi:general secretion pathway protein B
MSFILDALKKAEAERQRQSGPTLLELRVTAPRRRWPLWSVLIGILLVANIIVVLGTALRPRPAPEPPAAPNAAPVAAATTPATAAVSVVPTVLTTVPPPASLAPAVANPAAGASTPPVAFVPPGGNEPAPDTDLTAARAAGSNPADDEPAVAAPRRPARAVEATAAPTSEAELPSLSELGGAVPALRLDLHVYADRPADRYALINMHKAREGDMLPEGARVVAIDRDGVELSYHGTQFMLRPQ